jgi:hypothetical protein
MRILGFDIIICPVCSQLYKKQIIASSNTIGSYYFSDSYTEGPFIPQQPRIIKCINEDCRQFLQISTLKKIISIDYDDEEAFKPNAWETAYDLEGYKMGLNDLKEALDKDICNIIENEIIIRTLLLWRYNDYFRKDENFILIEEDKEQFKNNIERLIELKKGKTEIRDLISFAELHREIADFDTCIKILNEVRNENPNEKTLKEKIFSQAKIKNKIVFNVNQIAIKKEYRCDHCGESIILFDLQKLDNPLQYRHFICRTENYVFNDSLKVQNPMTEYKLNKLQKMFDLKKPHERFIDNSKLACPICKNKKVEEFKPEEQKCIKCGMGNYETIKWFDNN